MQTFKRKLVIKGYSTADGTTRETLLLHHFPKWLPDRQAAISVGLTHPTTVEEARTTLETYGSLRNEAPMSPKLRAVDVTGDSPADYVTKAELHSFGSELKLSLTKSVKDKFHEIKELLPRQVGCGRERPGERRDVGKVECYHCHDFDHYARDCPKNEPKPRPAEKKSENQ